MTQVSEPFPLFYDTDGSPLDNGMIYVGAANLDPRTNPVQVYWDEARTVPASQPIRTLAGRPAYQGAAANIYLNQGSYSITVLNKFGTPVTVDASVTASITANDLNYVALGTGAATRSVQSKLREYVSPEDFGAIGDGSLHPLSERYANLAAAQAVYPFATALTQQIDYCAIVAAINSQTFTSHGLYYHSGPEIHLKDGAVYRMGADTIQLKKSVRIRGAGSGLPWTSMAALRWESGATGIIVHRFNTIGAGVEGVPTTGADGSVLEGFRMIGVIGTADAFGGHGIWLRARAIIRDVFIQGFTANGINVVATAGGGGAAEGNANNFQIWGGRVQDCGGHGVYCAGADANAGVGTSIDVTANRLWGIWDSAFLGNSWIGCHTDSNGVEYSGATPVKSAYASFGGVSYHAVPGATEVQLRTTQPGTDRTRWRACTTTGYAIAWTGSNPTGTYRQGGGYYSDNANATCLFSGCYSEGGQGLTWLSQNSLALGGSLYVCPVETGVALEARQSALWSRQGYVSAGVSIAGKTITSQMGGVPENGSTFRFTHSDDTTPWALNRNGGDWAMMNADTTSRIAWRMTGELTAETFGSSANQPYVFAVPQLGMGSGADARRQTTGTAIPTTGARARGDIVWNVDPTTGGNSGWVCTVAGTPGTWLPFGPTGQRRGSAIPVSGTYALGEIIWNTSPAPSGKIGWVCTTAGTPGTWKAFGPIDA